eukprot:TRINITY_DN21227_c0_g1_i3.p1 TRINITY_DN21227_c0_g1~~TRINITY_DN21227_c0_g1_i3.p1  ORF type:complete len:186 (-),score=23.46 TRINITY_DN21227_c0_g1_i3:151-669(-)
MICTMIWFVVVLVLGGVFGKSSQECYAMGSNSGLLAGAENCKQLLKFCFADGKVYFPQTYITNRNQQNEVSFYGDCALSFTKGCHESCVQNERQDKDRCGLWIQRGSFQQPISGNKCQQQPVDLFVQTQCNAYCAAQARNIQQNSYQKDFNVTRLHEYVSKLKTQPLEWVLE